MSFDDLTIPAKSARQLLVEAEGTPFAPSASTRPVVALIDGRRTHYDLSPDDWLNALEAASGQVAVYFYLDGDHEWWLAYDADPGPGAYEDEHGLAGPYHHWSTYPSGPWEHSTNTRGILRSVLEELYGEGDPDLGCSIHRSKIVRVDEAPELVQRDVTPEVASDIDCPDGCEWTRRSERCGAAAEYVIEVTGGPAGNLWVCETHLEEADTDREDVTVRPVESPTENGDANHV